MKTRYLAFVITCLSLPSLAQNVGLGTTTPAYPLTVAASGNGIVQKNGNIELGLYTSQVSGAWLQTLSNHDLKFATNDNQAYHMILTTSGNMGIGSNIVPVYKLDIDGRMRLRSAFNNTAGIWFDGTIMPARSFIGTFDNDHVGIYGSVVGWNFTMNVENGNTGIGTSAPTERLDINGNVRIRGSVPKAGSILTSIDAEGNGRWSDPVAFRVSGLVNGSNVTIQENVWTKVNFNVTPSFNLGLNYQPAFSQFVCAEKGIYEFNVQLSYINSNYTGDHVVRLILERNGNTTVFTWFEQAGPQLSDYQLTGKLNVSTGAAQLLVGDKIWVETFVNNVALLNQDPVDQATLLGGGLDSWFTGHLIARN